MIVSRAEGEGAAVFVGVYTSVRPTDRAITFPRRPLPSCRLSTAGSAFLAGKLIPLFAPTQVVSASTVPTSFSSRAS